MECRVGPSQATTGLTPAWYSLDLITVGALDKVDATNLPEDIGAFLTGTRSPECNKMLFPEARIRSVFVPDSQWTLTEKIRPPSTDPNNCQVIQRNADATWKKIPLPKSLCKSYECDMDTLENKYLQLRRKFKHLFILSDDTTFSYLGIVAPSPQAILDSVAKIACGKAQMPSIQVLLKPLRTKRSPTAVPALAALPLSPDPSQIDSVLAVLNSQIDSNPSDWSLRYLRSRYYGQLLSTRRNGHARLRLDPLAEVTAAVRMAIYGDQTEPLLRALRRDSLGEPLSNGLFRRNRLKMKCIIQALQWKDESLIDIPTDTLLPRRKPDRMRDLYVLVDAVGESVAEGEDPEVYSALRVFDKSQPHTFDLYVTEKRSSGFVKWKATLFHRSKETAFNDSADISDFRTVATSDTAVTDSGYTVISSLKLTIRNLSEKNKQWAHLCISDSLLCDTLDEFSKVIGNN